MIPVIQTAARGAAQITGGTMYNWSVQNQIVAFVDSLRPYSDQIRAEYYDALYQFADQQSALLTMLGYPPVP